MTKHPLATLGLVGLAYGGIFAMGAADAPRTRVAPEQKAAAKQADGAYKALTRHDGATAVTAAEQAVAYAPRMAAYRMLLGQSYLQAGRFRSAGQAFADTLQLEPGNGKAALNLALTQIAAGDWQAARATLGAYGAIIPASDRGLALALAGDTAGAVTLLTDLARSAEATAKVRQNLALSYALGGRWQEARVVASADMSPADVDARMEQWAAFAQPVAASDQVASLLGVRPSADGGEPVALALNAPAPRAVAAPAPVAVAVVAPAAVRFGPRQEIVQPLAPTLIAREAGPIKVAASTGFTGIAAKPPRVRAVAPRGGWYVQLGAFESATLAKGAWGRAQHRYASFAGRTPNGTTFRAGAATFYRLSVGGCARADADQACRQYRARGGQCFVRPGAGDQVASWVKGGATQVAMR